MDGINNEFSFVMAINRKKVKELNPLIRDLIDYLFPNIDEEVTLKAWKNHYNQKTDVLIKANNTIKRISIKMGSRNSVHEESLESFIDFLFKIGLSEKVVNEYLLFHFGDGTTDGNGKERYDSKYLRAKYSNEIKGINKCLNREDIINNVCDRFIIKGLIFNDCINAIVYGTPEDFLWIKIEEIYKIMFKRIHDFCSSPHFGFLVIQPLNRCINYNKKYEFARYKVQLKWYSLFDDIMFILNDRVSSN